MKEIIIEQMIESINIAGNAYIPEYENLSVQDMLDFIGTIPQDAITTLYSYYNCINIIANEKSKIKVSLEWFKELHSVAYGSSRSPEEQLKLELLLGGHTTTNKGVKDEGN